MTKRTTYSTVGLARLKGHEDATRQCQESGSTETPSGGWDSWLIDGIGCDATWTMFGEAESANADEWTDTIKEKLAAYHQGAIEAAAEIDADNSDDDDDTNADLTHLSESDLALHTSLTAILSNETAILDPDDAHNLALVIVEELWSAYRAAPDLLAAVAHMLGAAEFDNMDDNSNVWRSYMIDARAAIAKATGEQL